MTIYIVMFSCLETGTKAYPFSTPEKAIAFAQSIMEANSESAKEGDLERVRMSEEELNLKDLLYYGCFSIEQEGYVSVYSAEIDSID